MKVGDEEQKADDFLTTPNANDPTKVTFTTVSDTHLDVYKRQMGIRIDKVLELQVEDNVIVDRMSGRRVCEKCGASYHIVNKKSKVEGCLLYTSHLPRDRLREGRCSPRHGCLLCHHCQD